MLFLLYINDLQPINGSTFAFFADDLKLWRPIRTTTDSLLLQKDIDHIAATAEERGLSFNAEKTSHLVMGGSNPTTYFLHDSAIHQEPVVRDLGTLVRPDLKTKDHTAKTRVASLRSLWALRRSFQDWSIPTVRILFTTFIRPILEYSGPTVFPCTANEEHLLEGVQRLATRMIPNLRYVNYSERCVATNLFTLAYRRVRGDMILTYKILRLGLYPDLQPVLPLSQPSNRRGHHYKIVVARSDGIPHSYRFSRRVTHTWNSLPEEVIEATTLTVFKSRLDHHLWQNRDDQLQRRVHLPGYPRGW